MTSEFGSDPTLRSYAQLVRRRKWWVIGLTLLGLAASLAISFTQQKQYSASAQVLVQASSQTGALGASMQPVTATEVQTMLQLVTSAPVTAAVQRKLGGAPSVSAAEVAQTNVIAITAVSPSPAQAARIANVYAAAFVSDQKSVELNSLTTTQAAALVPLRPVVQRVFAG